MTCLATDQGLGVLAKQMYDAGIVDLVYVHPHTSRENHYEWYPNRVSKEELLEKCHTLLFIEDPFDWKLIPKAREKGIKTVLIPMYECTRNPLPYVPDEIWSPSKLDQQYYPDSKFAQIPIKATWRLREKAQVFVHNAGNGGLGGRNGTKELIEAMQYVKSPIKLILRSQIPIACDDPRVEVRVGTFPYETLWKQGDVFVFPEKFNGLSLPIQEAFASGLLVMAGARFPNTDYLPNGPLIPVSGYHKEKIAVEFDCAEFSPEIIAATIDKWYNQDITTYSLLGKQYNEQNSYDKRSKEWRENLSTRRN